MRRPVAGLNAFTAHHMRNVRTWSRWSRATCCALCLRRCSASAC